MCAARHAGHQQPGVSADVGTGTAGGRYVHQQGWTDAGSASAMAQEKVAPQRAQVLMLVLSFQY
jgi:hypothetical protein